MKLTPFGHSCSCRFVHVCQSVCVCVCMCMVTDVQLVSQRRRMYRRVCVYIDEKTLQLNGVVHVLQPIKCYSVSANINRDTGVHSVMASELINQICGTKAFVLLSYESTMSYRSKCYCYSALLYTTHLRLHPCQYTDSLPKSLYCYVFLYSPIPPTSGQYQAPLPRRNIVQEKETGE